MSKPSLFLALLTAAFTAGAAPASCLTEEEDEAGYASCIEKASDPDSAALCQKTSLEFWDKQLEQNYDRLKDACSDPGNKNVSSSLCKAKLMSMQRSWQRYRDEVETVIIALHDADPAKIQTMKFIRQATKEQAKHLGSLLMEAK